MLVSSPESSLNMIKMVWSNKGAHRVVIRGLRTLARFSGLAAALFAAGCTPASGPSSVDVRATQTPDPDRVQYALVKLTPKVVDILTQNVPRLSTAFADRRPPQDIKFGVGDIVSVTIFEAAAGGLFIPAESGARPGNFITLPNQAVESNGSISVPYVGSVQVRGRTPFEVQQTITDELKKRAIEPQVTVSVVEQRSSMVSVLGEVNRADRFPVSQGGERLLDAIAHAGGPTAKGFDTWVMLERGGRRGTVPFGALVYEPSNNIYVQPNDTIYLYSEPQTFIAFGATAGATSAATTGTTTGTASTSAQGQFSFGAWRISLAEAVAKAGGLNDGAADPAAVFLYRGETCAVAAQLGVDCSKYKGPIIPIIYEVNFRDPAGYFLATHFDMRNKDVLYVSNAASVETSKVLNYLQLIMATADDPILYASNYYGLLALRKSAVSTAVTLRSFATAPPALTWPARHFRRRPRGVRFATADERSSAKRRRQTRRRRLPKGRPQ
jgi:polysaccharide biosynthesis/export protein